MVKHEKFGHLHLVYHFTVPLTSTAYSVTITAKWFIVYSGKQSLGFLFLDNPALEWRFLVLINFFWLIDFKIALVSHGLLLLFIYFRLSLVIGTCLSSTSAGLDKLHAWWQACKQRVHKEFFACTKLWAR